MLNEIKFAVCSYLQAQKTANFRNIGPHQGQLGHN
jgi:hypothetical protein